MRAPPQRGPLSGDHTEAEGRDLVEETTMVDQIDPGTYPRIQPARGDDGRSGRTGVDRAVGDDGIA